MEPILISSLLPYVQNAILNDQEKLNPDLDAYINETEIGAILKHFGAKDISELQQKAPKQPSADDDMDKTGLDTFEKSENLQSNDTKEVDNPEVNNEVVDNDINAQEANENEPSKAEVIESITSKNRGFSSKGSAAQELSAQSNADNSYTNVNTPYTALYNSLVEKRAAMIKKGQGVEDLDSAIQDVRLATKEYINENAKEVKENAIKNGEVTVLNIGGKPAILRRYIGLIGNNAMADKRAAQMIEDYEQNEGATSESDKTDSGSGDATKSTSQPNQFVGGVQFGATLETENAQINAEVNASSDNTTGALAGSYFKEFKNGSVLTGAANLNLTIEPGHNIFNGGAAVDYENGKFATGAYGYYRRENTAGTDPIQDMQAEAYVMYSDNARLAAGMQNQDFLNYYYVRANGQHEFNPNKNLKVPVSASAEVGRFIFDKDVDASVDTTPSTGLEFGAKAGVYYTADDLKAGLNAAVRYGCVIDHDPETQAKTVNHEMNASVMGMLQKGKLAFSAMFSAFKNNFTPQISENIDIPVKISSNIAVEYKDLYPGISPRISYTLDNTMTGNQHQVQIGAGFSIEKLAELMKK